MPAVKNSDTFIINTARSCAFTGHRTLYSDFNADAVEKTVKNLIKEGYNTFLIGMAIGFDTECFKILLNLKKENDIKIIACVPCLDQPARFNAAQKKTYFELLSRADGKINVSENYSPTCMKKRNEFMVNNSSVLVAYLKRDYGGTFNTVRYAEKQGKKIFFV